MLRKIVSTAMLSFMGILLFGQGFNVLTQPSSMNIARYGHAAIALPNGKVLVVGGHTTGFQLTSTAEIYDPTTDIWTLHNIANPHDMLAMVKLPNGNWMFMGGCSSAYGVGQSTVTTIYDPTNNTFTTGPNMARARTNTSAATLSNGNVLVMGNWYSTGDAELYTPASNQFQLLSVPLERSLSLVLPANDGSAFIVGGYGIYGGNQHTQVDYYDPQNNTITMHSAEIIATEPGFTTMWSTSFGPIEHMRLSNGNYIFMAWKNENGVQKYRMFQFNPSTKAFSVLPLDQELPDYSGNLSGPHAHSSYIVVDPINDYIYINSYNAQSGNIEEHLYTIDAANGILSVPTGETPFGYYLNSGSRVLLGGNIFYTGGTNDGTNFNVTATVQLLSPTNTFRTPEYVKETKGLMLYPNPVNESNFTLLLPNSECYNVRVYDFSGMLMQQYRVDRGQENITLYKGTLKPGTYIIEVEHRYGTQSTKVVIQ